jgi:hypothetical protein
MKKLGIVHHATPSNFKKRGKKMKKIDYLLLLNDTTEGVNKKSENLLRKYLVCEKGKKYLAGGDEAG